MNTVKDFLKTINTDPKAKELLKGMKEPENAEEAAKQYAGIAKELGFDSITEETLKDFIKASENYQKAAADQAEENVKEALNEMELNAVAGGGLSICSSTYQPGENCWFSDICNYVINSYDELDDITPSDPVQCANNTTNPHYMENPDFFEDWETWTTYCARDMNGEQPAPLPGPWDDV